jgi:Fe-S-cluster containining protein
MYMGDYIVIEHQISAFEFACESVSTGTPFIARIDDNKREIFQDLTFSDQHPAACRFLRPDGDRVRCTIHETSPAQCRFYRCVVMRVLDSEGVLLGTVRGTLDLHSDDPGLRAVWEMAEREISPGADDREERLQQYLETHGYKIE